MTYRTPPKLPLGGHDVLTASNAASSATSQARSLYYFTPTLHYSFVPEPMAAPGSLGPSASVPVTVSSLDANWQPVSGAQVCVNFARESAGGGNAFVGSVALTSKYQCFISDAHGGLRIVYATPASLPSSGMDLISVKDTSDAFYNTSSFHGYSFGAPDHVDLAPIPIAASGSLKPKATVTITVTPRDAAGAQLAGATVLLSLESSGGATASVSGYADAPAGTGLNATPKQFLTHTKTKITVSYRSPSVLPTTGTDRLIASIRTPSGVVRTTVATYSF
ncbi:hypothetical protein [Intrasporangium chromatireducens]|uniref:hypothetical protein n=1 Tax=Intrasporangium chromatireducens TaxID=1386088 RepID=UPI0012DDFEB8|nr:hypothetical protein [Intrasporangium chromatireducens]